MGGDGDPVGISTQVLDDLSRTAECWFSVDDPVLPVQPPQELVELFGYRGPPRHDRNGSFGESGGGVREDDGRTSAFSHGPHDDRSNRAPELLNNSKDARTYI
jgi:hypothetical protein